MSENVDVAEIMVRLVVERPDGYDRVNIIDLGDWLSDQLGKWIVLPFDNTVRQLIEIDIETCGEAQPATIKDDYVILT